MLERVVPQPPCVTWLREVIGLQYELVTDGADSFALIRREDAANAVVRFGMMSRADVMLHIEGMQHEAARIKQALVEAPDCYCT